MARPVAFWQKFGTLAQMAQASVALLGFIAVLFQINEIRSNSREAGARQVYLGYTDLAFKNPQFSAPDYDAIKKSSKNAQVQYESFVSYFLYSCEEAIAAFRDKREWQASCDHDLKAHLPFLCDKNAADPTYLATYANDTLQWIKTSMTQAGVVAPDCRSRKS
ncbi:MAG: hypothetical protein HY242_17460 [Afipia sp.]|nr:hypothetical protein [Afipia sp.]